MSSVPLTTRRRVLQALGVGGAAALAGCVATPGSIEEPPVEQQPQEPSMNAAKPTDVDRVAADPTDIPAPIDRDHAVTHDIELTTKEVVAEIEPGVTYTYMTFDEQIPGPMIRVRVGDTVNLTVTNDESNSMPHNVDLHAVRGPGGGAEASMVTPGQSETFRFKATYAGSFIYHCAVPNMDYHISSGMFGVILVEPEEGLPAVDHELYFGQHELYTKGAAGEKGHHDFDFEAQRDEDPTYVLINGEKYAITPDVHGVPTVGTDETVRVFFAVGGPNLTSNFHPIGSVFDEVYPQGSTESQPQVNVQTTPVLPGSCVVATMHNPVPGPIKLVDHALSRVARKGALAVVAVEGEEDPEIFDPDPA